jgi:hypothetical protein
MKLARDNVSFKIRLAAFQAGGGADTRHVPPVLLKKKIDIDGRNAVKFMAAVSDSAEIHIYLH